MSRLIPCRGRSLCAVVQPATRGRLTCIIGALFVNKSRYACRLTPTRARWTDIKASVHQREPFPEHLHRPATWLSTRTILPQKLVRFLLRCCSDLAAAVGTSSGVFLLRSRVSAARQACVLFHVLCWSEVRGQRSGSRERRPPITAR